MSTATPTVMAMGQLNFEGNVIPHTWYKVITYANGKPDVNAILILAEIIYWYRPTIIKDEATGAVVGFNRKFKADMLQRSYQSFADQFGFSKRQCQDAITHLANMGLVRKELRIIDTPQGKVSNVLFLEPVPDAIQRYTYHVVTCDPPHSNVIPHTSDRDTYTETTTETTTENSGGEDPVPIIGNPSPQPTTPQPPPAPLATPLIDRAVAVAASESFDGPKPAVNGAVKPTGNRKPQVPVSPSPHYDGRKFKKGFIPSGTGATAVEVYYEAFSIRDNDARLTEPNEEDLIRECPNLDQLRAVVTAYRRRSNYRKGNVQLILDWYQGGIPDHTKAVNEKRSQKGQVSGTTKQSNPAPAAGDYEWYSQFGNGSPDP